MRISQKVWMALVALAMIVVIKRVPVPVPTQHTQSIAGNPVPN